MNRIQLFPYFHESVSLKAEDYFTLAAEVSTLAYYGVFPYMNLAKEASIFQVFEIIQTSSKLKIESKHILGRIGLKNVKFQTYHSPLIFKSYLYGIIRYI